MIRSLGHAWKVCEQNVANAGILVSMEVLQHLEQWLKDDAGVNVSQLRGICIGWPSLHRLKLPLYLYDTLHCDYASSGDRSISSNVLLN